MLVGGILLSLSGVIFGKLNNLDISKISFQSFVGMLYMILIGVLIGYPVFVWLLKSTSHIIANSFTFVSPFISLVMGTISLNESFSSFTIVAAVMILGLVAIIMIINLNKKEPFKQSN